LLTLNPSDVQSFTQEFQNSACSLVVFGLNSLTQLSLEMTFPKVIL